MQQQNIRKQSATTVTPIDGATIPKARAKVKRQCHAHGVSVSVLFCSTETMTHKTEAKHNSNNNIEHYINIIYT
jgi:hypothetical protein